MVQRLYPESNKDDFVLVLIIIELSLDFHGISDKVEVESIRQREAQAFIQSRAKSILFSSSPNFIKYFHGSS